MTSRSESVGAATNKEVPVAYLITRTVTQASSRLVVESLGGDDLVIFGKRSLVRRLPRVVNRGVDRVCFEPTYDATFKAADELLYWSFSRSSASVPE